MLEFGQQVKIVKCTVKNISVDISFNQLAGLHTLCFLEQVSSDLNEYKLKALFIFPLMK